MWVKTITDNNNHALRYSRVLITLVISAIKVKKTLNKLHKCTFRQKAAFQLQPSITETIGDATKIADPTFAQLNELPDGHADLHINVPKQQQSFLRH